jgi:hypothetical protein
MNKYEVIFDKDEDELKFISLVNKPAIEVDYIKLSKLVIKLSTDDEKKEIYGPVIIPNLPIDRLDKEGDPYQLVFSEKTIQEMMYKTMSDSSKVNLFNIEHKSNDIVENNKYFILENWIKEYEFDKSNKHFDLPIGTWFMRVKITDDSVWERIKSEKLKGFSIEGVFNLKKVELSKPKSNLKEFIDFFNKKK